MAKLVSKTYSEAIYEVALDEGRLEDIQNEFTFVVDQFNAYPEFFEIIKTPKISTEEKKKVLLETFSNQISQTLLNFLMIIMDKKRGADLLDIKVDFDERVDAYNNIVKATVESVVPLTDEQLKQLKEKLIKLTGKNVEIKPLINPDLIGGLVVRVGDKLIDGSVKFKLEGMLESLTQIII